MAEADIAPEATEEVKQSPMKAPMKAMKEAPMKAMKAAPMKAMKAPKAKAKAKGKGQAKAGVQKKPASAGSEEVAEGELVGEEMEEEEEEQDEEVEEPAKKKTKQGVMKKPMANRDILAGGLDKAMKQEGYQETKKPKEGNVKSEDEDDEGDECEDEEENGEEEKADFYLTLVLFIFEVFFN